MCPSSPQSLAATATARGPWLATKSMTASTLLGSRMLYPDRPTTGVRLSRLYKQSSVAMELPDTYG